MRVQPNISLEKIKLSGLILPHKIEKRTQVQRSNKKRPQKSENVFFYKKMNLSELIMKDKKRFPNAKFLDKSLE